MSANTSQAVASSSSSSTGKDVQVNPRGIPKAAFIVSLHEPSPLTECQSRRRHAVQPKLQQVQDADVFYDDLQENVEAFLGGSDVEAEPELAKLNEMLAKYRFMEKSFNQKRLGLEEKMAEFKETLGVLALLNEKKEANETLITNFELTETLYAKAAIEPVEEVFLWLGANTMLSYSPEEAQRLLKDKQTTAQSSFENTKVDLLFLREQITTTEVNIARLYNHDVKLRRERRLREQEEEK